MLRGTQMCIEMAEGLLNVFERDAGICQYCGEDLLWSYSVFESARFDRIPSIPDGWITCCDGCYRALRGCNLDSFEKRKAFAQQQSSPGIRRFRATAERIRASSKGGGILARLIQAELLRNGDVISMDCLLPGFLQHQPGDPAYQAIVDFVPGRGDDVIYLHDSCLYSLEFLTFEIFQRGYTGAPYRKTRFSWAICPADHWATNANISLTELRVRLDWNDLPDDEGRWCTEALVEAAKAVLPSGEEFPVSFLQRRFLLGYSRACKLYRALRPVCE